MPKETGTQSIERAITILKTFSQANPELGVTEISRRLGLHRSTVHRLIGALEREGLLSQNAETGRYRLGLGLITLAGSVNIHEDLRRLARPWLQKLANSSQETVSLSVLESLESVNLDRVLPPGRQMVSYAWPGRRLPGHSVSTGKILMAFLPQGTLRRLLDRPLQRFTRFTIIDPEELFKELEKVKKQGYATGIEELEEGLSAVAAPIRDEHDTVVAAVAISGPTSRLSKDIIPGMAMEVITAANDISHALGWEQVKLHQQVQG
jgi:DNA-binding IclR family transcriptional regulator